jgi:hypothetical protein
MAKYEVNFSCGHTETVNLIGKHKGRERKIEWLKTQMCYACYQDVKQSIREKELEAAKEQAEKSGLPELLGSEKQVAWAETIRKNALASAKNAFVTDEDFDKLPKEYKENDVMNILKNARKQLETEVSAKWWIENRGVVNSYCAECADNYQLNKSEDEDMYNF